MFDLSNLNDYEFEELCKDVMERLLEVKLYNFARGVDGGVDICDAELEPEIVIQAKHYVRSKYSNLRTSLNKEIIKVQKLNPRSYYVCTSLELTRENKKEIVEMFKPYMNDISDVLDKIDINNFLSEESNQDIVKKHYKLWLCSSNVISLINNQSVFIDCEELMKDIEKSVSLFVNTKSYFEARHKLAKNNIIIITGAPGVGKSTISKMLLLFFASEGYLVRYTTNNEISDIKNVLSQDINKKEIVLLDDFLGQHYLKMRETQPNELKTLISFIENNPNKKIIMNSRITILNEAFESSLTFRDIIERHKGDKYFIDLDKMSTLEKAQILYNHMYFNNLPNECFLNIKLNKNYYEIVKHKNYNPRIIEYATNPLNYKQVLSEHYYLYIIDKLNRPEDVWRDEFRNRLSEIDRMLMNILYSLTDTSIEDERLEKAFNRKIREHGGFDTSINHYKETKLRLTDSLLKNIEGSQHDIKISVLNPSINDYLSTEIKDNANQQLDIIKHSHYFEQIMRMDISKEASQEIINILDKGDILEYDVLKNSSFYYYLSVVIKYNIFDTKIKLNMQKAVESAYKDLSPYERSQYGKRICTILSEDFYEYYSLNKIFTDANKLKFILRPMHLKEILNILDIYINKEILNDNAIEYYDDIKSIFSDIIVDKISEKVQEKVNGNLYDIISDEFTTVNYDDIATYKTGESDYLENHMWDKISDIIYENIEDEARNLNPILEIDIFKFDTNDMRYYFDIEETINQILNGDADGGDDYEPIIKDEDDTREIEKMFER